MVRVEAKEHASDLISARVAHLELDIHAAGSCIVQQVKGGQRQPQKPNYGRRGLFVRMRAGSNRSMWLVVMKRSRSSDDATPSSTLRRPLKVTQLWYSLVGCSLFPETRVRAFSSCGVVAAAAQRNAPSNGRGVDVLEHRDASRGHDAHHVGQLVVCSHKNTVGNIVRAACSAKAKSPVFQRR